MVGYNVPNAANLVHSLGVLEYGNEEEEVEKGFLAHLACRNLGHLDQEKS